MYVPWCACPPLSLEGFKRAFLEFTGWSLLQARQRSALQSAANLMASSGLRATRQETLHLLNGRTCPLLTEELDEAS